MSSDLPSKPHTSNSGTYVWAAIAMLVLAGGLVTWRLTNSSTPEQAAPPPTIAVQEEPKAAPPPPPPPPPEEQPSAAAPEASSSAPAKTRLQSACSGECQGEVTAELRTYLSGRAGQGRKCYERALLQNGGLKGRMKVQVRINPQGQLCSAAMASDELQDPGLNACILQMFRSSVYPAPKGGCVDVAVPLSFVPQQ